MEYENGLIYEKLRGCKTGQFMINDSYNTLLKYSKVLDIKFDLFKNFCNYVKSFDYLDNNCVDINDSKVLNACKEIKERMISSIESLDKDYIVYKMTRDEFYYLFNAKIVSVHEKLESNSILTTSIVFLYDGNDSFYFIKLNNNLIDNFNKLLFNNIVIMYAYSCIINFESSFINIIKYRFKCYISDMLNTLKLHSNKSSEKYFEKDHIDKYNVMDKNIFPLLQKYCWVYESFDIGNYIDIDTVQDILIINLIVILHKQNLTIKNITLDTCLLLNLTVNEFKTIVELIYNKKSVSSLWERYNKNQVFKTWNTNIDEDSVMLKKFGNISRMISV